MNVSIAAQTRDNGWHYNLPQRWVTGGTLSANYSGLTLKVSANISCKWGSGKSYDKGLTDTLNLVVDGSVVDSDVINHGTNYSGGTGNMSASASITVSAGNHSVTAYMKCNDGSSCSSGAGTGFGKQLSTLTINVPNPYSKPAIVLNSVTQIGRLDSTNYTMNYKLTKGTDAIKWTRANVYTYNGSARWHQDYSRNSSGTFNDTFKLTAANKFANGSRYQVRAQCNDGTNTITSSAIKTIYTYQEPKINTTLTANTPQNANTANTFKISGTNNRAWSSLENDFQTRYRIKLGSDDYTGWTNIGNITTWSRTAAQMRSLIPKAYDGQNCTIQMKRYSPSPNWYSSNTASKTIVIYYRPRIAIGSSNTSYRINNSSGTVVNKGSTVINNTDLTSIYVAWTYDTSLALAGYTQGYRIRLYDKDKKLVKTYYSPNRYYNIPKADIPKLQKTYIDITPYFANDTTNTANYWYYNAGTIEIMDFVQLLSQLDKPVITYPVQDSNWINNQFRICFTLPRDPDKGTEFEEYHYEDIELKINGTFTIHYKKSTGETTSGTVVLAPQCFSALQENLTYQRKIVIYPALLDNFPITNTYTLQVRVKKKYTTTSTIAMWSAWSDVRNITITKAVFEPNVEDKILATHYNNTLALVERVRNAYGVNWTNKPEQVVKNVTVIARNQYQYNQLYTEIVETKNQINNYATRDTDRDSLIVDKDNLILENFEPVQELVTAASNEDNSPNGRNYMKIVYDRCNRLL